MKYFVTGSTGLIGSQVVADLCKSNNDVYSSYHQTKPEYGIPIPLNLTNKNQILENVNKTKPDCIIHLAAMTGVDQCEVDRDLALSINKEATKTIAKMAAKINAFFLYVSTDYVFDGNKGNYTESDIPKPVGFYGKTKLEGELSLNQLASSYSIARTSTPFGLHKTKKTFPLWIKENLELQKEIPILIDQVTSPTYVPNLSKMIIEVATRKITGVINLAGSTRISRYEFAQKIAEKLRLDKNLLKPITIEHMSWKAKRPQDSSLDVSYANEILNEKPLPINQSLDLFVSELNK
jgi:dTDP-4-dehydrorhamnose reductase